MSIDTHETLWSGCPSCGNDAINVVAGFQDQNLVRCSTCSLVFDRRVPTQEELASYYRQYSYSTQKPCPPATWASFDRLLRHFEAHRQTGNILDVGCGQGDFLEAAQRRGWDVEGTEYSEAAVSVCRLRELKVRQGALDAANFGSRRFDVITAFEVIEHVNSPNDMLAQISRLLRPGGLFYCTTPNFDAVLRYAERSAFEMICYPEHLCFYTKRSLRHLAKRHEFTEQKVLTTGIDLPRVRKVLGRAALRNDHGVSYSYKKQELDAFRSRVQTNPGLAAVKYAINEILSITGLGDTLKGYFIKR